MRGRRRVTFLAALLGLGSVPALEAQRPSDQEIIEERNREVMSAGVERADGSENGGVDAAVMRDEATIVASKDKAVAKITYGKGLGKGRLIGTVTAPVNKSADATSFLTLDGPADDVEAGLAWKARWWNKKKLTARPEDLVQLHHHRDGLCRAHGVPAAKPCTDDELRQAIAGQSQAEQERILEEFDTLPNLSGGERPRLLRDVPLKSLAIGATVGRTERKYFTLDADEEKEDRLTYSFSAGGGRIYSRWLWRAQLAAKRKFKEADKGQSCSSIEDSEDLEKCKTLPVGRASAIDSVPLSFEIRTFVGNNWALSPKIAYDFENEIFAGSLPWYFIPGADGRLSGGIRLDWEEGKEAVLSVFVSSPFGID